MYWRAIARRHICWSTAFSGTALPILCGDEGGKTISGSWMADFCLMELLAL